MSSISSTCNHSPERQWLQPLDPPQEETLFPVQASALKHKERMNVGMNTGLIVLSMNNVWTDLLFDRSTIHLRRFCLVRKE